jgi:hypothetical protein
LERQVHGSGGYGVGEVFDRPGPAKPDGSTRSNAWSPGNRFPGRTAIEEGERR